MISAIIKSIKTAIEYSYSKPNIVKNGNFNLPGVELVTNGDFSVTGSELVTDGSFPLGTTAWNVLGTTSLSDGYTTVVGMGATYSSSANFALNQIITVFASKSYVVKFTARIITGSGEFYSGWSDQIDPQPFQQNITSSFVEYTYYKPANTYSSTYNTIAFSGEVGSTFEIKDITVKELGEDWTLGTGWSIIEDKAKSIQTTSSNYLEQTVGTLVNAKNYKITFDLDIISATTTTIGISNTGAFGQLDNRFYTTSGTKTIYGIYDNSYPSYIRFVGGINTEFTITNITIKEVGQNWTVENGWVIETGLAKITPNGVRGFLYQNFTVENYKSYRLTYQILENTLVGGTDFHLSGESSFGPHALPSTVAVHNVYIQVTNTTSIKALRFFSSATSGTLKMSYIYLKLLDPDEDWILSSNDLSIGENRAKFNNTTVGENFNQQKFTIEENVTYRASFSVLDYVSGSVQWKTTGGAVPISSNYEADGDYTFDFIGDVEGGTSGIRIYGSSISNNNFAVTNVSVKKLATYLDQSIYVTAADVQTIAQATVSYLIELKSMASQNSIYFIPTSITANNGRYTKMNFTVVSKDGIIDPADGIISFYDSNGGEDTYPMGFYEFKIYEQPILPVNLDPTNATKLLEKGTAFVQNINGNTSEITSAFNEYDPTLTQYVYSQ